MVKIDFGSRGNLNRFKQRKSKRNKYKEVLEKWECVMKQNNSQTIFTFIFPHHLLHSPENVDLTFSYICCYLSVGCSLQNTKMKKLSKYFMKGWEYWFNIYTRVYFSLYA